MRAVAEVVVELENVGYCAMCDACPNLAEIEARYAEELPEEASGENSTGVFVMTGPNWGVIQEHAVQDIPLSARDRAFAPRQQNGRV